MRSLLFVPGDSARKLEKALGSGADALIVDLEDSVSAGRKGAARLMALSFLREQRREADRPIIYVRINGFDTGLSEGDLDAVMPAAPDGIMLPKAAGGPDMQLLDARIGVREALHGLPDGRTRILPIATETAISMFELGTYRGSTPRLASLSWGAEDLSADIGAPAARSAGEWTDPFRLARNLCLFGAAAAGIAAIDTVYTEVRDLEGLQRESETAARDGFAGKLAIHPGQVPIINTAFTPAPEQIAHAERVVAAFAEANSPGVTTLDGRMLDKPHLRAAERLLARAAQQRS